VRELGTALNAMTSELDQCLRELAESRDQLRGALSRLGATLSSSLDLDRTLAVVTDAAMDNVQADRATLILTTEDDDLEVKIDRGFGFAQDSRFDEHSLPGWVVRTGLSVRRPADHVVISSAVDGGVLATHQLSVPVSGTAKGTCCCTRRRLSLTDPLTELWTSATSSCRRSGRWRRGSATSARSAC
jgi:hypothetical protein